MKRAAWIAIGAGVVFTAIGFVTSGPAAFDHAWLVATLFVLAFPLGSLGLTLLHQLTSGGWGDAAAPIFRAAIKTLPFTLLPIAVVLFRMPAIYSWASGEHTEHALIHKAAYLDPTAFIIRTAVYFAIYLAFAFALQRARKRGETWMFSGPALVLYGLTSSFFAIDYGMSLEPLWYSTIYPLIVIVGHGISALALALVIASLHPAENVTVDRFHDLAKLLFAFIMLWGYTVFSQLLIIWSGNVAEEVPYYLHRTTGGWDLVTLGLFAFGFVVPFIALLSKEVKRNMAMVRIIACWLIVIRIVENAWLVLPAFEGRSVTPFDLGLPLLLGGGWLQLFIRNFDRGDA
jgi:hypothetical protein